MHKTSLSQKYVTMGNNEKNNSRVVILGSNSFVLSELIKILKEKKLNLFR